MPADSASEVVKFTITIPRESCTNAKAKYSSSVVPPDPSVHFYHCPLLQNPGGAAGPALDTNMQIIVRLHAIQNLQKPTKP